MVASEVDRAEELAGCSDDDLARALISGERRAGAELWRRYSTLVFRLLLRKLGSRDEAHDVTQEVFCQILRSVRTLRDPTLLRAWVVSVALRTMKWQIRKRRVWAWVGLSEATVEIEARSACRDAEAHHIARQFLHVLDTLDERGQTTFVLRYVEGLALAEIAEATHVSLATVKRDLARVSQRISKMVDGDDQLRVRRRGPEGMG
jgi:RNA polymerase sigma-70 factor (ECF subfamily)